MKTAKEALATFLDRDMSDLAYYNYQPGRFTRAVYAINDGYYCAVKDIKNLPKPTRNDRDAFNWIEQKDEYVNKYGWLIFKA